LKRLEKKKKKRFINKPLESLESKETDRTRDFEENLSTTHDYTDKTPLQVARTYYSLYKKAG
jgi:hypothetical protein